MRDICLNGMTDDAAATLLWSICYDKLQRFCNVVAGLEYQ
jgi:hypothetical protein